MISFIRFWAGAFVAWYSIGVVAALSQIKNHGNVVTSYDGRIGEIDVVSALFRMVPKLALAASILYFIQ